MKFKHSLPINLDKFGFVEREKKNNKLTKNRCGRDFLYYALHFYYPEEFSPMICGPAEIEKRKMFGMSLPSWLVWTCLPFYKVPRLLMRKGLVLKINHKQINSFLDFSKAIVFPKHLNIDDALKMI